MNHPLQTTQTVEWNAGEERRRLDEVVAEEPLEIRLNAASVSVTMRTPGHDFELAAGFLFTEGIIDAGSDLADVSYARRRKNGRQCNTVDVTLRAGKTFDAERLRRHFSASSSCGMCGKASIISHDAGMRSGELAAHRG
jgi:FdhD protein